MVRLSQQLWQFKQFWDRLWPPVLLLHVQIHIVIKLQLLQEVHFLFRRICLTIILHPQKIWGAIVTAQYLTTLAEFHFVKLNISATFIKFAPWHRTIIHATILPMSERDRTASRYITSLTPLQHRLNYTHWEFAVIITWVSWHLCVIIVSATLNRYYKSLYRYLVLLQPKNVITALLQLFT